MNGRPAKGKRVAKIDPKELRILAVYPSASEAARQNFGTPCRISQACRGISPKAYGFLWRFLREDRRGWYSPVPFPGRCDTSSAAAAAPSPQGEGLKEAAG